VGTIDTKEKYDEHRLSMAERVWEKMEATDSRECRRCHVVDSMAFDEQQGRAARKHESMKESGKTCIKCHKGVAHELPPDYEEGEDDV
jgi:nitrate/TMAO reductase-like tetraheme cytochrome c subunit